MQDTMETDTFEDLCRCCLSKGTFKSLNSCFKVNDVTFAALLIKTFNITVLPISNTSLFCICEDCIHKLHDAAMFKQLVLECEEKFYKMLNAKNDKFCIDEDIKTETIDGDDVENDINNDEKPTDNEESVPTELEPEDEFEETIEEHVRDIVDSDASDTEYVPEASGKNTEEDAEEDEDSDDSKPIKVLQQRKGKGKRIRQALSKKIQKKHVIQENNKNVCDICGKLILTVRWFSEHMKTAHSKPYACTKCPKTFELENQLKRHDHVSHGGDNPFTCQLCDKQFKNEYTFLEHRRTHTREITYPCDYCDREFTSMSSLMQHEKYTHKGKQRKKRECKICNKQYLNLSKHMLTAHSDEKPFACSVCDKRFTLNENLKLHMRSHTGERPYSCEMCDKRFTQPNVLKTHVASGVCLRNNQKKRKSK